MVKVIGVIDYDSIKDALASGEGKIQLVDSGGNPIGDIPFSALLDGLKPIRSNPEPVLSSETIDANDLSEFTVSDSDGYSAVVVTVKAAYHASATQGVRVRWLYSPNGSDFDSEDAAEAEGQYNDITFTAGATKVETVLIPLFQPYVKVQIVNKDTSYSVTVDAWKTLLR